MRYLILAVCLGLFAGMPLISSVQAETIGQGQVVFADEHGTTTKDNSGVVPSQPGVEGVTCNGYSCP